MDFQWLLLSEAPLQGLCISALNIRCALRCLERNLHSQVIAGLPPGPSPAAGLLLPERLTVVVQRRQPQAVTAPREPRREPRNAAV